MKDDVRRRFITVFEATGIEMKQASLAPEPPLGETYVSEVIRKKKGSLENVLRIVAAIAPDYVGWVQTGRGEPPPASIESLPTQSAGNLPGLPAISRLTIVGRIGAGAQIDVGVEQVPEGGEQIETVLPLPAGAIGFEVVGDSMWPRYDPGDIIVCEADGTPIDQLPDGEEAAVRTTDGLRYLKRVYRGQPEGFHNLISHNAAPINGAQLDWAADVVAIIRKARWRKLTDADRKQLAKKAMVGR